MGSMKLAYPSIAGKTSGEQLESMRRYLCTLTDQLNLADWSAGAVLQEVSRAIDADSLPDAERKTQLGNFGQLKALIIKTADYAAANSESFKTQLSGNYITVSDFGKYWQKATMTVDGNEFGIRQLYDYAAGINNDFAVNSKQYVKTGLLYYNGAVPVYGVGVGNIETTVTKDGETVVDQKKNELVTVTPGRVSFWQGGDEIAYLSAKKLHFPSGTLEATNAKLSGTLTAASGSVIGPWTVAEDSIYRTNKKWGASDGLYFGTSGLSLGSGFKVDASGAMTAKGATISGTINATDLQLGGVSVQTKLQAIMAQIDAITDSVGNVTGLTVGGTNMKGGEMYLDGAGGLQFTPSSSAPEGYATDRRGGAHQVDKRRYLHPERRKDGKHPAPGRWDDKVCIERRSRRCAGIRVIAYADCIDFGNRIKRDGADRRAAVRDDALLPLSGEHELHRARAPAGERDARGRDDDVVVQHQQLRGERGHVSILRPHLRTGADAAEQQHERGVLHDAGADREGADPELPGREHGADKRLLHGISGRHLLYHVRQYAVPDILGNL